MIKVSFDFDSTLDRVDIQQYALDLISKGIEVWICTSRSKDPSGIKWIVNGNLTSPNNDDLYQVAEILDIPHERIIFTDHAMKSDVIKNIDFKWHLNDDYVELNELNSRTKIKGISCWGNTVWKYKCNKILGL